MTIKDDRFHPLNEVLQTWKGRSCEGFWGAEGMPMLDYDLLLRLLAIPVAAGDSVQSGRFAGALDLWIARELERAGFDADMIWPRSTEPRVVDPSILKALAGARGLSRRDVERFVKASGAHTDAVVMGSVYSKQMDVGMSSWPSGPELLISTKTMGSSFGKNLSNRFEEAYGDVKNLRARYPLAAHGFFFLAHRAILDEPSAFAKVVHMLSQLSRDGDVYDAVALLVLDWSAQSQGEGQPADTTCSVIVEQAWGSVPVELSPERFFSTICDVVLANSPADRHKGVREARRHASENVSISYDRAL